MSQIYHKKKGMGNRIMMALAAYGASQVIGIPFVGGIIAAMLDGLSMGAAAAADAVEYVSGEEALSIIDFQAQHGAHATSVQQLDDGRVLVHYDTSNYTGPGLETDQYDRVGDQYDHLDQLGEV